MNAPTRITPALDPIEALRPWGTPEEKALRRRLHTAMVIGAARATRATAESARRLYWEANTVASAWVFASAPEEVLKDIADSMVRLFEAAGTLERLEGEPHGR